LLFIIFAVVGYFAYRQFGWVGVAGDVIVYLAVVVAMRSAAERRRRLEADRIVRTKLSEEEKHHLSAVSDHQKAMEDHRAQFDPELRRSRSTEP